MTIQEDLVEIERYYKVKILLAIESGSRAWGMASENSDFDIRFVYVRPKDEYLSLDTKPDVIERKFGENEYAGFDFFKFLKLLRNNNPSCIEWLFCPIVYKNEMKGYEELRTEVSDNFNPLALYQHYKSMCKENYLKYLKTGDKVTYKKYLYAMRGLLNAKWVEECKTIPSIAFRPTLVGLEIYKKVPKSIIAKVKDIIELKKKGKEEDIIQNEVRLDEYI